MAIVLFFFQMCSRGNRLAWKNAWFHSLLQHRAAGPRYQVLQRSWEHLSHSIPASSRPGLLFYGLLSCTMQWAHASYKLPVNQVVSPLMTLQASSFPLVKLSFSWLRSVQGNSLPQDKCPTAPFSFQLCHFPHVEVVGMCWFCSSCGKLCCLGLYL